jgi:hypothetical protein
VITTIPGPERGIWAQFGLCVHGHLSSYAILAMELREIGLPRDLGNNIAVSSLYR